MSQDECQTLDSLLTKQQVYYPTNYPQPKRRSEIDLPTPTGPFSIESIINYRPPVSPSDPKNNIRDNNTPHTGNNNDNSDSRAWRNTMKRRNLRYSWNPFVTSATNAPASALRRHSELAHPAPYNNYNAPLPTPPSSTSSSSERVCLVQQSEPQINESAKSTFAQKQSDQPPHGQLSVTNKRAEQTAPPNTTVSSNAASCHGAAKLPQEPTDTAPCSSAVLGAGSSSSAQRDSFIIDKSTELTNKNRHSDAAANYESSLNSGPHHQQSLPQVQQGNNDLRDGAAASDQSQLTGNNHCESSLVQETSGHLRESSDSSSSCFRFSPANANTLNIGDCASNSTDNNNNHSLKPSRSFDEDPTQDISYCPGSPISIDSDTNSLISLYFDPLSSNLNPNEPTHYCYPDMPLEVAAQRFPLHSLPATLSSPTPSLTNTAFSSLVTRDSFYNQLFPYLTPAANAATADIFERSVQHQYQQQKQQDGSAVNIPLHFFNDDFIPTVLQASTEALTEPRLSSESIDVLTSRRRPSSLRSFSFSDVSVTAISATGNQTPVSLASGTPASDGKQSSYESIIDFPSPRQQSPQPRPRVLSFCSFVDLVTSEHPEGVEPHSSNNIINKQEIASPVSLNSLTVSTNSTDENDAGDCLPYPPTRPGHHSVAAARSRRSSIFSAAGDNDDMEVTSLRQVIRQNSAIMTIS